MAAQEGVGNISRCPDVGLTVENNRRHVDLGQHVT
jgi:hypothetical protein